MKSWNIQYSPQQLTTQSECPICYETVQSHTSVQFNCNHIYCFTCIYSYISSVKDTEQSVTCPMCRTVVTDITLQDPLLYNTIVEIVYQL